MPRNKRPHHSQVVEPTTPASGSAAAPPPALVLTSDGAPPNAVARILGEVTKDDLISVIVQEHTDALGAEKARLDKYLRDLDTQVQSLGDRLNQCRPKLAKTINLKADERAAAALVTAGYFDSELAVEVDDGAYDDAERQFTFTVSIVDPKKKKGAYDRSKHERTVVVPLGAEARDIVERRDKVRADIAATQQSMLAVKRQISNMPDTVQRARCEMAKLAISRDTDGQALLDALRKAKVFPALSG